jgi:putative ABC transport system permease protein
LVLRSPFRRTKALGRFQASHHLRQFPFVCHAKLNRAAAIGAPSKAYRRPGYQKTPCRTERLAHASTSIPARSHTHSAIPPALAGVAAGVVAAWGTARTLSSLFFGVSASDPATFAVVAIALTAAVLAVCVVPGLRAARVPAW